MNVRLCLAMNDDNGYSIGKVRQIEAYVNNEHAYTLEPTCDVRDVCTCEIFTGSNQLHLGKFIFPLIGYRTQVGNYYWNDVEVTDKIHAKIFEVLKDMQYKPRKGAMYLSKDRNGLVGSLPKWRMTEGLDLWIKRWDTGLIGVWIDQGT